MYDSSMSFGNVYIDYICIDIIIPSPNILGHHHNARNEGSGYLLVELTLDTWGGYYFSALFIIIIIITIIIREVVKKVVIFPVALWPFGIKLT